MEMIKEMRSSIRVVSYNILSSYLFKPRNFIGKDYREEWSIDNLDNRTRLNMIIEKLSKEIHNGFDKHFGFSKTVICLQEVDIHSADIIQVAMSKINYNFIYRAYGNRFNGYMGTALLIPLEMEVLSIDSFCLSEGKKWPSCKDTKLEKTLRYLSLGYIYPEKTYYGWNNAKYRKNIQLTAEIRSGDSTFLLSTVHLPCKFKYESVMLTYCTLAMEHLYNLSNSCGNIPYILAGDFNVQPDLECYNMITTEHIDTISIDEIFEEEFPPSDLWRPYNVDFDKMTSSIAALKGKDPEWTTKCHTDIFDCEPFQGCLDYIFVSNDWSVANSFEEPEDLRRNLPNMEEPSDHLLMWTEVMLNY